MFVGTVNMNPTYSVLPTLVHGKDNGEERDGLFHLRNL